MKLPIIIVAEGTDVNFLYSLANAEIEMEPIDVRDEIYQVFSADGKKLVPSVRSDKASFFTSLESTELIETGVDGSSSLIELLIDFYVDIGLDVDCLRRMELFQLVEIGKLFFFKNFRKHHPRKV